MKNYTITVNGNVYDVTVEENNASSPVVSAPVAAPKAAAPAPKKAGGSVSIVAPMPGKILSIKAKAGTAVKKGQVVLVLEAMKMENEIVAPKDGTICEVVVQEGANVEAGAVLAGMD